MFDKSVRRPPEGASETPGVRPGPEDERIALRCNRKELQLLDSFVANGEFRSRSELMRSALLEFLRARAQAAVTTPTAASPPGLVEVPVRLRTDEVETFSAYARSIGNGRPLSDVLAEAIRHGEAEMKVSELVKRARAQIAEAGEARASFGALRRSAEDLERRGVVGR